MEDLLSQQKIELVQLKKLYTEYQTEKDNQPTEQFLQENLESLEKIFASLHGRNEQLKPFETLQTGNQPYFAENKFLEIEAVYQKFKDSIVKRLTLFNRRESIFKNSDTMSLTNVQYADLLALIDSVNDDINDATERGYMRAHLSMMETSWNELRLSVQTDKVQGKVIDFDNTALMKSYMYSIGKLNELLSKNVTAIVANTQCSSNQFSLPKIKLPEFFGKPSDWKSFISLFDRMVHNNSTIDNGLKIEYLKTCIKGDAAKLIKHVDPTPDNYQTCYDIIHNRYENKREILGQLIDNILNLQKIKSENAQQLKNIHDTVYESIMSIKNLDIDIKNWDPLLNHILLQKLDPNTIMHYECQLKDVKETQTLKSFLSYLENRFMAIQSANSKNENAKNFVGNSKPASSSNEKVSEKINTCAFCNDQHSIYKCSSFAKNEISDRINCIKTNKFCINCLGPHKTNECKSKFTCKTCDKKHNTLLHLNISPVKSNLSKISSKGENNSTETTANCTSAINTVLLATALVGVKAKNCNIVAMRVLIDQGSQSSFISENALQMLKLTRIQSRFNVSGIGETNQIAKYVVDLQLHSHFKSSFVLNTQAIVLKKLTKLSTQPMSSNFNFAQFSNLKLADPSYMVNSPIDIMLGAAEYAQIIKSGLVKTSLNQPIAQDTELGWIISGPIYCNQTSSNHIEVIALISNVELEKKLSSFFESEIITEDEPTLTHEQNMCETFYQSTVFRDKNGRYVIKIPFKNGTDKPDLGKSRKLAIATQFQLEKRFLKYPKLESEYRQFMNEYISLGHMEEVKYDPKILSYYMPHHCVFKESTTTKLRVVFNASQKSSNNKSLNEQLAMGSLIQNELISTLMNFRIYEYAFCSRIFI